MYVLMFISQCIGCCSPQQVHEINFFALFSSAILLFLLFLFPVWYSLIFFVIYKPYKLPYKLSIIRYVVYLFCLVLGLAVLVWGSIFTSLSVGFVCLYSQHVIGLLGLPVRGTLVRLITGLLFSLLLLILRFLVGQYVSYFSHSLGKWTKGDNLESIEHCGRFLLYLKIFSTTIYSII